MRSKCEKVSHIFTPILSLLLISIVTLWMSAALRSKAHLEIAQTLEDQGEIAKAASHYQWSARAHAPFMPYGEESFLRLWRLYEHTDVTTQRSLALTYLDLMRGVVWSTRWLMSPYAHWESRIDHEIVLLRGEDFNHRALIAIALADDPRPSIAQSSILLISFLGVLISVISTLKFGVSPQLKRTKYSSHCLLALSFFTLVFWVAMISW